MAVEQMETEPDDPGRHDMPSMAEELFALRFELDALADALVSGKAERWVDGFVPAVTTLAHRRRYDLAASRSAGLRVLDLSCGAGAGSYAMARAGAAAVVGVDIDGDAIRYARHRYGHERCRFLVGDAEAWSDGSSYDLIVSFETIEHLRQPSALLATIGRLLAPGGEVLVSTPVALGEGVRPTNPYHLQEWTVDGFLTLVRAAGLSPGESWFQGVRHGPGLTGRLRRRVEATLRPERRKAAEEAAEGLLESSDHYRRAGLTPKFQIHRLVHAGGS